jgi:hypothetical protein
MYLSLDIIDAIGYIDKIMINKNALTDLHICGSQPGVSDKYQGYAR